MQMDARLQEIVDHYEITKTLREYCHGCDRADEVRMRDVYLADSWDDHGPIKAPGPEFSAIITRRVVDETKSLSHMLGQSQINVNGDEAGAETYFHCVQITVDENGVDVLHQLGGRYVDRLERENGLWKIRHRTLVRDWSISTPITADWQANQGVTQGERSNDDPSYAVLGLTHSGPPSLPKS